MTILAEESAIFSKDAFIGSIIFATIFIILNIIIVFADGGIHQDNILLLITFSILAVCFIILSCIAHSKAQTQYKVTLDDSYPAKEFLEKYEIKDIEGEIYTIIEKEKSED